PCPFQPSAPATPLEPAAPPSAMMPQDPELPPLSLPRLPGEPPELVAPPLPGLPPVPEVPELWAQAAPIASTQTNTGDGSRGRVARSSRRWWCITVRPPENGGVRPRGGQAGH